MDLLPDCETLCPCRAYEPESDANESEKPQTQPPQTSPVLGAGVAAAYIQSGNQIGFLNDLIAGLWDHINAATSTMTKEICEPLFEEMLPGPLKSLCFEKLDIGRVPFHFDNFYMEKKMKDVVKFHVDIVWDGQCDIDLKAGALKAGVEKVKLRGRVEVILAPLLDRMPIVSAAQVSFINPPELELDFTGVADVADIKVIDKAVRKIIHQVVADMLVLPNRLLVKVDPANNFLDTYVPHIGFARITVVEGKGYKEQKKMLKRDIPDVYCIVQLGTHPAWKTTTQKNDTSPVWNESKDFLLSDHEQIVTLKVFDKDKISDDDELGEAETTVGAMLAQGGTMSLNLVTKDDGKDTGSSVTLRCDIYQLTKDISSFSMHRDKDLACGLLTILITGAFDLPGVKEEAASMIKVTFGKHSFQTPVVVYSTMAPTVDPLNPLFDCPFQVPLQTEDVEGDASITFSLMNGKSTVGIFGIPLQMVLESEDKEVREKREVGAQGASVEFSVIVRGTALAEK